MRFLLTILFCLTSAKIHAATHPAATPSKADVETAVTAASNGDTIIIPSGTATWTATLTVSKAVTFQGAGIGQTIIKDGMASGSAFLIWNMQANLPHRLTAITFTNAARSSQAFSGNIQIYGRTALSDTATMRVDHCAFDNLFGVAIQAQDVIGVFDHCTYQGVPTSRFVNVFNPGWDGGTWGDKSFTDGNRFGTEKTLYIENNTMTYAPSGSDNYAFIDSWMGARWVARFNSVTNGWFEAHGTDSGNRYRGTRAVEAYGNIFTGNDIGAYVMNFRSGVVLCFSNTATGYTSSPRFELASYRVNTGTWSPWGRADGSNQWDTNNAGVVQEVLDQPGRSGGSLITGDETPTRPWSAGQNNQVDDPCYEWANTEDGGNLTFEIGHSNIRATEHYALETVAPGYTPLGSHSLVSSSTPTSGRNSKFGTLYLR